MSKLPKLKVKEKANKMGSLVPGQDVENLYWFFGITSGLVLFGVLCFLIAKRVYGIV